VIRMWENPPYTRNLVWLIDWLVDRLREWMSCYVYLFSWCRFAMVRMYLGLWVKSQPGWHGYRFASLPVSIIAIEICSRVLITLRFPWLPQSIVCTWRQAADFFGCHENQTTELVNTELPNDSTRLVAVDLGLCVTWEFGLFVPVVAVFRWNIVRVLRQPVLWRE
jgi:hypothetical protein